ncbi:hypothetical protein OIV83_002928 [Microbotryomycetes sp. JL201]|nr:hypothetical protein OIV83_002928 [Microbotryomycetes sp. JL201]
MAPDDSTPSASAPKKPRHRAGKNQRPRTGGAPQEQRPQQSTPTSARRPKPRGNQRDSSTSRDGKINKKGGFQVGPRLGKGQYTGHLKKTKQTLIHKAKVKRQYQKDLVDAGYAQPSSRQGRGKSITGPNATVLGKRKQSDVVDADENLDDPIEQSEQQKEAERERLRKRMYGEDAGHETDDDEARQSSEDDGDDGQGKGRAMSRMQRATIGSDDDDNDDSDVDDAEEEDFAALPPPPPARRLGQRLPLPKQPKPSPAAQQQQRQPKRPRLTPEQIEQLRLEREKERKVYAQRTARGCSGTGGAQAPANFELMPDQADEALALLESIFPDRKRRDLLRYLQASSYNVDRACSALLQGGNTLFVHNGRPNDGKRKREQASTAGLQAWLGRDAPPRTDNVPTATKPAIAQHVQKRPRTASQDDYRSAFAVMQQSAATAKTAASAAPTPPNLPVLRLTNDAMIKEHTRNLITLIPNVLPTELANRLFLSMVAESQTWERNRWYMFDREVVSPHTTSFYVAVPPDATDDDRKDFSANATHWYNGEVRSSRPFTAEMNEAREVVGEWTPNVSAANCYTGKDEGVGWHSDVLTHLGPYPTIASLSLGVARPFRLRPFKPMASGYVLPLQFQSLRLPSDNSKDNVLATRTLEIMLPHNSLCIMHGGCQELFKHSIPPVSAMDLFRLPGSSQTFRERINVSSFRKQKRFKFTEPVVA